MNNLLEIRINKEIPFLVPLRKVSGDDFAPVREEEAAIHFIMSLFDDEKVYEVTETSEGFEALLKLRFLHSLTLKEELSKLEKDNQIKVTDYHTSNIVALTKVHTLKAVRGSREEVEKVMDENIELFKEELATYQDEIIAHFNLVGITLGGAT
jgi:hypothetical protein